MAKLVRDKLVEKIPAQQLHRCENSELDGFLHRKLREELDELIASDFLDPNEFADVIEVLMAIAWRSCIGEERITFLRLAKMQSRGGFANGLVWTPPINQPD